MRKLWKATEPLLDEETGKGTGLDFDGFYCIGLCSLVAAVAKPRRGWYRQWSCGCRHDIAAEEDKRRRLSRTGYRRRSLSCRRRSRLYRHRAPDRYLEDLGHDVIEANPVNVPLKSSPRQSTDRFLVDDDPCLYKWAQLRLSLTFAPAPYWVGVEVMRSRQQDHFVRQNLVSRASIRINPAGINQRGVNRNAGDEVFH